MMNGLDSARDGSCMPLSVYGEYIFFKICRRFCLTPVLGDAIVYQVGRCVEIGVPMLILFVAFSQVLFAFKEFFALYSIWKSNSVERLKRVPLLSSFHTYICFYLHHTLSSLLFEFWLCGCVLFLILLYSIWSIFMPKDYQFWRDLRCCCPSQ